MTNLNDLLGIAVGLVMKDLFKAKVVKFILNFRCIKTPLSNCISRRFCLFFI